MKTTSRNALRHRRERIAKTRAKKDIQMLICRRGCSLGEAPAQSDDQKARYCQTIRLR
jgi:hypothetical protein